MIWFRYEMKNMLADRKVVCVLIGGPLLFFAFVSYVLAPMFSEDRSFEKINIALVNLDESRETRMMLQQFIDNQEIQEVVNLRETNTLLARQWLENDQVSAVITIPENFGRDMARGVNTPIEVVGNEKRPQQSALVQQLMQSGANMVTAAQSGINTIYFYMEQANVAPEELNQMFRESIVTYALIALNRQEIWKKERISAYGDVSMAQHYLVNAGILFIFLMGLFGLRVGAAESKLERRLRSFGIQSFQLILVRLGSLALFIVGPYLLYFVPLMWMMKESFQGHFASMVVISVLLLTLISSFYLFISVLFRHIITINLVSWLIVIGFSLIGGTLIPLAFLPSWFESMQPFSMLYWMSEGWFSAYFHQSDVLFWRNGTVLVFCIMFFLIVASAVQSRRGDI